MICLTVSLRGLPIRTLPEAQTLLEEPYGPEGRRAATGAAGSIWQSGPCTNNQNESTRKGWFRASEVDRSLGTAWIDPLHLS